MWDVCKRLDTATDSLKAIALEAADLIAALESGNKKEATQCQTDLRDLLNDAGLIAARVKRAG